MSESLSSHTTEPGRIARDAQANQTGWKHWLPGWNTLRAYESSWLLHDLVAGLVMTTMLVPVGIAYAEASGVPGINGLYATIVALLAYVLFGPSRILVLGPDSAVLGRVDRVKGYHDIVRYPAARLIPGLVVFRWHAPLFFANADLF